MNILWIALQEAEHAAERGIFDLNIGVSFWTVIIFVALLFLLKKYAFPPILGYAQAREERIQEILDAAANDREEAERLLEEQRRELGEARRQAEQIVGEGRQSGERVRQEMLEQARADQEAMLERARREIEREREAALAAIRREAVELSIAAAGRLVESRLDGGEDRRLVEDYLEKVAATTDQRAGVS